MQLVPARYCNEKLTWHGNGTVDSKGSWYLRKLLVVVVTASCISKHIRETLVAY